MRFVRQFYVYPLIIAILAFAAILIPALAGAGGQRTNVGDWQDEEFPNLMLHPESVTVNDTPPAALPADTGDWQLPISWPADAVHMLMLYTGQVLFFRGDEPSPTTYTWNPETNQVLSQSVSKIIWCGGHNFLPDGRVLMTGGALTVGSSLGPRTTFIFDPSTAQWTRMPDMRRGRYYPTQIALGDGRSLVFAGSDENGAANDLVEAYIVGGGAGGTDLWDLLVGATKAQSYYPRMHLLPTGEIVLVGPDTTTRILDPVAQTWRNVADNIYGSRTHGTSVLLPQGYNRIMIAGGHNRGLSDPLATSTTEIIDLSSANPDWVNGPAMRYRRMHANTALLPDGKVLVAGGTSDENITPVYPTEMYDPQTNAWTEMAPIRTFRGYHSSMVLLPDGRVVMAGSNGNPTAEIYSPPYLFRGARPAIDTYPLFVQYGQNFTVGTASAASISSVVFMRPGASTHSINMEQRYIPLTFSQSGAATLNVISPPEPSIAPPGYYMMFILNSNKVPSIARWVQIGGSIVGNRRPSVDAGPSQAIVLPATSNLNGTVSDDNQPDPPGALTTRWSVLSGPGPVIFGNENAVDTTATFSVIGDYVLRLEADDGALIGADSVIISVGDASTPALIIDKRVGAGSDDAEEAVASRVVNLDGGGDLEMTDDEGVAQLVGMRFTLLNIPRGAPIQNAWIQFRADEITSVFTSLTIQGQAVDNAPTFAATTGNISGRARTSASVPWQPAPWLIQDEVGSGQRTPNLKTIIQEIVNRPAWNSGNSIGLIVSGTGKRVADSYEGWYVVAPLLHVEVGGGPPPPPPVNHEPAVNAGPDRTITFGQAASLDGTVSDDGLPSPPGTVTTLWVKESGPGNVTFTNPNAVDTTAQFTVEGRYELQLIANDSEFSMTDTMAVTVGPAPVNQGPTVDAGPSRTILLNQAASLDGTVSDDGLPNPPGVVTTLWSKQSGPGSVTFTNASAVDTTAMFSVEGQYELLLTVNDSQYSASDTMAVTVNPPPVNQGPTVDAGPALTTPLNWAASLDGTVSDDGLPNPPGAVTTLWSKQSGPGNVTFTNASAVDTTARFSAEGQYELLLTVNDSQYSASDTMTVTVGPVVPIYMALDRNVSAGNNDVEERGTGTINLSNGDLDMVLDKDVQKIGIRFPTMPIPSGATITSAYVQFRAHSVKTGTTSLLIQGQAADNPGVFTTSKYNVSSRPRTAASVAWTPPAWSITGERGVKQQTPDLTAIIQQLVNRPGWVSGNAMVFIITGSGVRSATAYEGGATVAPTLHVEWVE